MSDKKEGTITIVVKDLDEKNIAVTKHAQGFFSPQFIKEILQNCIDEIELEPLKS